MLLFYIGLLALSSWAEIVLSILILDTNNNRELKLGYSEVGLCSCFIVIFIFSHQFGYDKSTDKIPFYYVNFNNIRYCCLWKIIKIN